MFIAWALGPQSAIVPGGKRWLVKYVIWHNPAGTGSHAVLQVRIGGGAAIQVHRVVLGAETTYVFPSPFVLEAGDELTVTYGAGTTIKVHASGIEFTP